MLHRTALCPLTGGWILVALLIGIPPDARADTVTLSGGEVLEGIIERIDAGRVTLEVGGETRELDIREVDHIDFNTPHLSELVDPADLDHFLGDADAQEMVRHVQELRETAAEIGMRLDRIRAEWLSRDPIDAAEVGEWDEVRDAFRRPVLRYREVLEDLYYHVVAHVDEYHRLMGEANDVYVGVEGLFRVGSSLAPRELRQLPFASYMPRSWYDAIFYEGYLAGYDDAYRQLEPELNSDP